MQFGDEYGEEDALEDYRKQLTRIDELCRCPVCGARTSNRLESEGTLFCTKGQKRCRRKLMNEAPDRVQYIQSVSAHARGVRIRAQVHMNRAQRELAALGLDHTGTAADPLPPEEFYENEEKGFWRTYEKTREALDALEGLLTSLSISSGDA